jgi:hypothetical protein
MWAMSRFNPLRHQPFCFIAATVNVIAMGLAPLSQGSLVDLWAGYVLLYVAIRTYRDGFKILGWSSLALVIFASFHVNELPHVMRIWLLCGTVSAVVGLIQFGARRIRLPLTLGKSSPRAVETVELAVPAGTTDVSAAAVLAQFGLGA